MPINYNKLRKVFLPYKNYGLLAFAGLIILLIVLLPRTKQPTPLLLPTGESTGMEALQQKLEQLQKEASFTPYHSTYDQMQAAKTELTKTEEEIRQELLSAVNPNDQLDFETELETIFDVGVHKSFFIRQIENCKIKMDLAVVGIGIINVHQVLRGENPSVLEKDRAEFIRYVKQQVQYALGANDKNYKAIVFKGLESSYE